MTPRPAHPAATPRRQRRSAVPRAQAARPAAFLLLPLLLVLAGCANGLVTAAPSNSSFSIAPGAASFDTNCTRCNAVSPKGAAVEQFHASLPNGEPASVTWSVSGGDANNGPGSISATGQYTPPSYLTGDRALVTVTATLNAATNGAVKATSVLTITPGFLQPLTPENAALGVNGQTTITGFLAEAGGNEAINFALADSATGSTGGLGSLSLPSCQRTAQAFTLCTVTYTAPPTLAANSVTYVVATAGNSTSRTAAALLLNAAGITSNPASHQAELTPQIQLGASGGNNVDYDTQGHQVADCCGGTLGALIQDNAGHQYLLSNNHVLARSDHAAVGDTIVQPGLIDNNCTPLGDGPGTAQVGSLTSWLPLSSKATNADAAIAQVAPGAVDPTGSILELGLRQPDGMLAAAPPGISSTAGKGETAILGQQVAKSGRTTGLTCGSVSALDLDVNVDYYRDCAETKPYLTRTFTNQVAVSGNQFSDAGDSGSLVVDSANAEPLGLFFAGGIDASGVSQGVASPAPDVLAELGAQSGGNTSYSFVGAADHPVSCLSYGDRTIAAAQARTLADAEITRTQQALAQGRLLINPAAGILGVATGKSTDHPGEGAILVYTDEAATATVPATIEGVRTAVIPTNARAVAQGSAPSVAPQTPVPAAALNQAIAVKQRIARSLLRQNPAFFGVGVGQSLDNPREPALVLYADRKQLAGPLPATIAGLRTRYLIMDRLHVTRSFAAATRSQSHCLAQPAAGEFDPASLAKPLSLNLN